MFVCLRERDRDKTYEHLNSSYVLKVSRKANAHGDGDGDEDGMLTRPNNRAMKTLPVMAENRFSNFLE